MTADGRPVFRRAFVDSLPVLMGYTTMGFCAGVLLAAKGNVAWAPLWGGVSAALWVSGTMAFAVVPEIAARASLGAVALLTLAVNFRYAFYGFAMLRRWRNAPRLVKFLLVLGLADENFALEAAHRPESEAEDFRYCTVLTLLDISYWVFGVVAGALSVVLLGMAVDPETIRRHTNGMEFAMAALFLVIFTDQIRGFVSHEK
ncbi:MAG: AzlC family ABC transporter permease [Kiritimatiellae bacterium]|nr:AzlC family ABC transporter permease [Kiritimatiellia bacterium]